MATERVVYVDPDASGSANGTSWTDAYTSIKSAHDSEAGDISSGTGSNEIIRFLCRSSSGTPDSTSVSIVGWTVDNDTRIIFESADEHGGTWNTSAYRVDTDATDNNILGAFDIAQNSVNVTWSGMQIYYSGTGVEAGKAGSSNGAIRMLFFDNLDVVIDKCIIKCGRITRATYGHGIVCEYSCDNTSLVISNSILFDNVGGSQRFAGILVDSNQASFGKTIRIFNNTIISADTGVAVYDSVNVFNEFSMKNCAFVHMQIRPYTYVVGTHDTVYDWDYLADETGDWLSFVETTGYTITASDFTDVSDPAHPDASLPSDSLLIDAGVSLTSEGVTDDIIGSLRPQESAFDIGAFEYVVVAPFDPKYSERTRIINIT